MTLDNTYKVPCLNLSKEREANDPILVSVPGSKSITNRALLLATLAEGTSTLTGALFSDDSRHFLKCIRDLGFETGADEENRVITVAGHKGAIPKKEAFQYVGSAGTAARFLTAYLGVSKGIYHMDASAQMRKRPMAPLLNSLQELGCRITYGSNIKEQSTEPPKEGFFPFTLESNGFEKDTITINIDHSSQFLSALLIAAVLSPKDFTIQVEGNHGMSYIEMTCKMMNQFGVQIKRLSHHKFFIPAGQHYQSKAYRIEPDASAACYFYAMCPLLGIPVLVEHIHFDSLQGDVEFVRILEQLGCKASDTEKGILLLPPKEGVYPGITVDMSACSDQAITLAAIAPFATSPTIIRGIGHIRLQESDRIKGIVTELGKMGISCDEQKDSITIYPGNPTPSVVETYDDHRMAMGFSLIGLRVPGITIGNPGCCRKTFEDYFDVLENCIQAINRML